MTFNTAFPSGSNVIVTLAMRDRSGRLTGDHCALTVANASVGGFTLQLRDMDGGTSTCSVPSPLTVNYIAVAAQ